MESIRIFRSLQ